MDKDGYFVNSDNIPPLLSSFMQGIEQAEQMIRFASKETNLSLELLLPKQIDSEVIELITKFYWIVTELS